MRVRAWAGLHAKSQNHPARGSRRTTPVPRGTGVRVAVERGPQKTRAPQQLWLWWRGPGTPDRDLLGRASVQRCDLAQPCRFGNQTRGWTTPRGRHPEQAGRWTGRVVAAYPWTGRVVAAYPQVRRARACVRDQRRPWERLVAAGLLTPYRGRRAVSALLLARGAPARPPPPCGRSPGRPSGRRSGPAPRYPALNRTA